MEIMEITIYFLFAALGVIISIFLPGLTKLAKKYRTAAGAASVESAGATVWKALKPYVGIAIFAMVTALLLIAALGDAINDWKLALIFGYAWESTLDSTIQKLVKS
jgi:hypothetical protein